MHRTAEGLRLKELKAIITDALIEFERRKDVRQKVTDKFNELNEKSEGLRYKLTKYDGVQDSIDKTWEKVKELEGKPILAKKIASYTRKIKKHEESLVYLEEVTIGFSKQGIPNVIIARALQHLGERANHYLDILTNGAIGIKFSGFSLTKKGAVRNKIGIEVISASDVTDFDSYSGGERQRLNIALLLALRDVAEFNRGVSLNVLLLDEVLDRSLDKMGAEAVLELLSFLKNRIDSIFVFTPKDELLNDLNISFDSKIHIEKIDGFSVMR
jgi:exonuclease SbcC